MKRISLILMIPLVLFSCSASKVSPMPASDQAPVIVYKTKADYALLVPVTLNENGDEVLSFPAPSDLQYEGEPSLPVRLKKGFLLDQRGLHVNSAFTSYTYAEYSALKKAPSPGELLEKVVDADPFSEIYLVGKHGEFKDLVKEVNKIIAGGFEGCNNLLTVE